MSVKPNLPSKKGAVNTGQMKGGSAPESFGNPSETVPTGNIDGMGGTKNDIGEMSGFVTQGYLDKKGTPYGEAAKLNLMPPGMEIADQEITDQRTMPMKRVTSESYPGDGWGG